MNHAAADLDRMSLIDTDVAAIQPPPPRTSYASVGFYILCCLTYPSTLERKRAQARRTCESKQTGTEQEGGCIPALCWSRQSTHFLGLVSPACTAPTTQLCLGNTGLARDLIPHSGLQRDFLNSPDLESTAPTVGNIVGTHGGSYRKGNGCSAPLGPEIPA